ncbi:MAG: UDP-N-acetylmuramoyl-tripeptide--D-alanyl-D-alanine ligase [Spirochaetaceae bacterium]|jgi:UDP-N-acetylmuramoyl-tripeptide--D-alanyl-D-alanine ligase|nr:UDP-N-acetylmuramoyl-tripeptide--D-alanyl-D-alanine ligase [Spirochaetaceae bacterium]
MLMSFDEAAQALACPKPHCGAKGFSGVCIDSREAQEGFLFAALPGENADGRRFIRQAFSAGASGAIVERAKLGAFGVEEAAHEAGAALLVVEGSLRALQDLAGAYLDKFPALLKVGITGSSGKTTTKELVAAMAGCEKKIVCNSGNLNSETGLPLSLFEVRKEHDIGIFEAGMNRKGEIAELAAALRPHVALITNIGSAHVGCIGGRQEIALEKKALFSRFTGGQTALIPEEDEFALFLAKDVHGKVRFFGDNIERRAGTLGKIADLGLSGWEIVWEGGSARFALPGRHNLKNALAAAALGKAIGLSARSIKRGLESAKPLFGRSEIFTVCGGALAPFSGETTDGEPRTTLIRDCYNANPESMSAAIGLCDALDWKGRRVYVAGSMLELGEESGGAHRELGRTLAVSRSDAVFLFGEETKGAFNELKKSGLKKMLFQTNDIDELKAELKKNVQPGDLILLKGSRGCALERVCEALM